MSGSDVSVDVAGEGVAGEGVAGLERRLGDPWDPGNPVGFAAVVAADERAELLAAGERLLDAYGLGAEFVPVAEGGRLASLHRLVEVMRAVYRRDPCLGLGHGVSSFLGAVNVWTAGRPDQRRAIADVLRSGGKVACAYHELAHGNDLARADCAATAHADGWLWLSGGKEVIANVARAQAMVLFARTAPGSGGRTHSQLLVEPATLPPGRMTVTGRYHTAGMRGVPLGGVRFRDCPVPAGVVVGEIGQGLATALRSFQVTRIALSGMTIGILDTALRVALRHAHGRRLYGRRMADLPLTRRVLASAFADLLLADCLTTVAANAVHLAPEQSSVLAAAVKYLVPTMMMDAVTELSTLLGAQFYIRDGEYAVFQKLVRDIAPSGFGHASRASCQATILPQLPLLARRSWLTGRPAPAAESVPTELLFRLRQPGSAVPFQRLAVSANGNDSLATAVAEVDADGSALHGLAVRAAGALRELAAECVGLTPRNLTVAADPRCYRLAARYAAVLAASACLNVWRYNQDDPDSFLRNPAWVRAVGHRLAEPLGGSASAVPSDLVEPLYAELVTRHAAGRTFDMANRPLGGGDSSV